MSDGQAEIANASAYPLIRVVQQAMVSRPPPLGERDHLRTFPVRGVSNRRCCAAGPSEHASVGAGWYRPAPDNMGGFCAVCWMFGRRMQAHLGIPVGLIEIQVGGTAVERWSSTAALSKCNQERGSRMGTCKASTAASEAQWLEQMEAAGFDR